ncbi:MAG: carboxymuconolactone decarboxylase family protein [Promethearchaeota archaeon]
MSQEIEKPLIKKVNKLSNPRIAPLEGEWHKSINKEYSVLNQIFDGKIINVHKTIARYPKLMKNWYPFFAHIVAGSRLPKRDREIIILRIGWLCQSEYEWAQHAISAESAGFTEEEIQRITKGPNAEGWNEFEKTLIRAVDELHTNAFISDVTWKKLSEKYDDKKLMDLIFTVGEYNLVSMFLNSVGVQIEEGKKGFPD